MVAQAVVVRHRITGGHAARVALAAGPLKGQRQV